MYEFNLLLFVLGILFGYAIGIIKHRRMRSTYFRAMDNLAKAEIEIRDLKHITEELSLKVEMKSSVIKSLNRLIRRLKRKQPEAVKC